MQEKVLCFAKNAEKEIKNGTKFCIYCGAAQTGKTMPRVLQ